MSRLFCESCFFSRPHRSPPRAAPAPSNGRPEPLTMVVPFAAGGPNDVVARLLAQSMGEILGQHVIVENVGGAGGMTAPPRRQGRARWLHLLPARSAPRR